jgi:hypothetical protein
MRPPRVRLRALMIAVAVFAIVLGVLRAFNASSGAPAR